MKNLNKIVYGYFRNKSLFKRYNYAFPKTSYIDFFGFSAPTMGKHLDVTKPPTK